MHIPYLNKSIIISQKIIILLIMFQNATYTLNFSLTSHLIEEIAWRMK